MLSFVPAPGLSPSCETLLLSEMTVTRASLKILNSDVGFSEILYTNSTAGSGYKFFVPRNVDVCTFKLTITKTCDECHDVHFAVQSHSLPTSKNYLQTTLINSSQTGDVVIEFYPHENAWHYVDLKFFEHITNDGSQKSSSINASDATPLKTDSLNNSAVQHIEFDIFIEFRNSVNEQNSDERVKIETSEKDQSDDYAKYIPFIPKSRAFDEYLLLRQTYREFFMYDYDLVPDANGTVPISINLTAGMPALMKFDIGGKH